MALLIGLVGSIVAIPLLLTQKSRSSKDVSLAFVHYGASALVLSFVGVISIYRF